MGNGFKKVNAIEIADIGRASALAPDGLQEGVKTYITGIARQNLKRLKYYIMPTHEFFTLKKGHEFSLKIIFTTGDIAVVRLVAVFSRKFVRRPKGGLMWAYTDCEQIGDATWN